MPQVAVLVIDAEGRVEFANAAAHQLLGAVEGLHCNDVVQLRGADGLPICHPGCALELAGHGKSGRTRVGKCRAGQARVECSSDRGCTTVVVVPTPLPAEKVEPLSPREREVLGMVAQGYTDEEISRILGVQVTTTRTHLRKIRTKLVSRSRAEAVARAMCMGLLPNRG